MSDEFVSHLESYTVKIPRQKRISAMISVPRELYTKEIIEILEDAIVGDNVEYAIDIDEIHKHKLFALASKALGYDVEVIISQESLKNLSHYIINNDHDSLIDFYHKIKEDAFDHFEQYYQVMIQEIICGIEYEKHCDDYERYNLRKVS